MSKVSDFIGKKVGEWAVTGLGNKKFTLRCKCSCGTERTFSYAGVKLFKDHSSCGCKSKHPYPKAGDIYPTNGGDVEVLERLDCNNIRIKFLNGGYEKTVAGKELRTGNIANPYSRDVYGVGFWGEGNFIPNLKDEHASAYRAWTGVLQRTSGNEKFLEANPTYTGATVCELWHCFQEFAGWYFSQSGHELKFDLDKDLLVKGNKHYSPETCALLPREVNTFMVGNNASRGALPKGVFKHATGYRARCSTGNGTFYQGRVVPTVEQAWLEYKFRKESYARELAAKWQDKIDPRAYEALMSYEVEITD